MSTHYEYLLVGGGVTSVWAAQNIRETDKQSRIAIVGDEPHPPYDRPPLSKGMILRDDMATDDPYSKFDDFYPKNEITLFKSTRVTTIDKTAKTATLSTGDTLSYDKLLLATGSRAKTLDIPGANRPGVYLLRSLQDALAIREAFQKEPRVVIIGGGYIGMEAAAAARGRGLDVTIIEPQATPWAKFASETFGKFFQTYYEEKGVAFVLGDEAVHIAGEGENGPVNGVVTRRGLTLSCDCVIVGVGAELNTELAKAAGLEIASDGGVKVNELLQTSDPNIWAAGDIAHFKDIALDTEWRTEHHLSAKWQGQAVGKILAGDTDPFDRIAYFFTDEFDLHVILRGKPDVGLNSIVTGNMAGAEFTELYYDNNGTLKMALSVSRDEPKLDAISDVLETLIRAKVNLKGREAELQSPDFELSSLAPV